MNEEARISFEPHVNVNTGRTNNDSENSQCLHFYCGVAYGIVGCLELIFHRFLPFVAFITFVAYMQLYLNRKFSYKILILTFCGISIIFLFLCCVYIAFKWSQGAMNDTNQTQCTWISAILLSLAALIWVYTKFYLVKQNKKNKGWRYLFVGS